MRAEQKIGDRAGRGVAVSRMGPSLTDGKLHAGQHAPKDDGQILCAGKPGGRGGEGERTQE